MTIIDRYLLRQFAVAVLFALIAFSAVFIIIDLIENLGSFVDNNVTMVKVVKYYLYFLPDIISLMMPVALLLASLFTVGRLTNLMEITAIKVGGISTTRILVPFMFTAFLITGFQIYFSGWVVPKANKLKAAFEATELGKYTTSGQSANLIRQDSENRMVSIGWFDGSSQRGYTISITDFKGTELIERWDARNLVWSDTTKLWTLENGMHRTFGSSPTLKAFSSTDSLKFNFKPRDLLNDYRNLNQMTFFDLDDYIESQRLAGFTELDKYLVTYYSKISFPFACMVVVLFGVPLSSKKKRGGLAVEFGLALLICFVYLALQKVAQTLGYGGDLNPLTAAWFANVVFFLFGLYMLWAVDRR